MKKLLLTLSLSCFWLLSFAQLKVEIYGVISDSQTGETLIGANIVVENTGGGTTTDLDGKFQLSLEPGTYNITASYLGYESYTRSNFLVQSQGNSDLNIELNAAGTLLDNVEITASPFARSLESPLSLQKLSPEELKTYPGGNNDIAKVVQSLPGISGSIGGFRNDIIIRGGAPNENVYYLDGIEIPNINHFSTQGSAGGPAGLLNVSFIEGVELSASSFGAKYDNPLSGVLQFDQRSGNKRKFQTNFRVSASEAAATIEGPLFKGDKEESNTTFLFSLRRSYLQLLFQLIGLPIRPSYWDYQYKFDHKIDEYNSLIFTGIGAIDDFTLKAPDDFTPEQQATLEQVPLIEQYSVSTGLIWKRRRQDGKGIYNTAFSFNRLRNQFSGYEDNENQVGLNYQTFSRETEFKLRPTYTHFINNWSISTGFNVISSKYTNKTQNFLQDINYEAGINFVKYGLFVQAAKANIWDRLDFTVGIRSDANTFTEESNQLLKTLSPRAGVSVRLDKNDSWRWNATVGSYYKIAPYTILGFQDNSGNLLNKDAKYINSIHFVTGLAHYPYPSLKFSVEGFYKLYNNYPISIKDGVSLANQGGDFSILGDEDIISSGKGRTYGGEFLVQQKLFKGIYAILAYTYFHSEFADITGEFKPSAWDSRHLLSFTGGWKFGNNYELSVRSRLVGQTPYAPVDLERTLDEYPLTILDYDQLGANNLEPFYQTDIRFDKKWNAKMFALNLYFEVQNVFGQAVPTPPSYGLDRNEIGEIILPSSLILLPESQGIVLPSIGIVLDF
ncbi:TonB-dependent receptor [Portibacter lacus]|uniref:Collagen-binding protein n=1 Tax=Portibacter lacus TaxID=1099794 RepID=A0AA37WBZ6_9BACT|nr:TonB-dependent receptor [Portibacter lacus]GLR15598.1 collagen-binding protein [Portibacter lacus]